MSIDTAIMLFKGPLKEWVAAHDGAMPSLNSSDPKVKELAVAYQMIYNLKIRKMKGLEYEPENND